MKIKSWLLGLIILVVIFGGIGSTMAFNLWQTEGTKIPSKFEEGEFAGEYNPADIRGSYSFGDISDLFEIPLADLVVAFGLDGVTSPQDYKISDLESVYAIIDETEIGTDSVRIFVGLYTGLPYELIESAYFPQSAVTILLARVLDLSTEQIAFLDSHSVDVGDLEITTPITDTGESESAREVGVIKGSTTFGDLLDWGLTAGDIEIVMGGKLPDKSVKVRDYAVDKGVEFSVISSALQAKLISLP